MTTLAELETKMAELQAEIDNLKNASEWPRIGDDYWVATPDCAATAFKWNDDTYDRGCMAAGIAFQTVEEAEMEVEARKSLAELKRQPGAKRFTAGGDNWSIFYNHHINKVGVNHYSYEPPIQVSIWFDTLVSAHAAIQAVGEDRLTRAAKWHATGEC